MTPDRAGCLEELYRAAAMLVRSAPGERELAESRLRVAVDAVDAAVALERRIDDARPGPVAPAGSTWGEP